MKIWKQALTTLSSSSLLWVGAGGALVSFLTYALLWSGHLMILAEPADAMHLGLYLVELLAFIFTASVGIFICGAIIGIVRLCRLPKEQPAAKEGTK